MRLRHHHQLDHPVNRFPRQAHPVEHVRVQLVGVVFPLLVIHGHPGTQVAVALRTVVER